MSEAICKQLKSIYQKNVFWGMFNLLIVLPLWIYGLAFVDHEKNKILFGMNHFDIHHYFLQFLAEPIIFSLIFLVLANTIVDFWVYRNYQKAIWKIRLMCLNLAYWAYLIFMTIRGMVLNGMTNHGKMLLGLLGILVLGLMYKLIRYEQYYWYYRLDRSMVQAG